MIINKRITEAIKVLRGFEDNSQMYWLNTLDLCNSEKGFIMIYLELGRS